MRFTGDFHNRRLSLSVSDRFRPCLCGYVLVRVFLLFGIQVTMATAHVDEMESLLSCSVCLGILQDPRTLGCFHSFCKDCLKNFVRSQRVNKAAEAVEAALRGAEERETDFEEFFCPVCRSTFRLKQGEEVEGMKPNHFICNMLEVLAIQRQAKEIPCSLCQGPSVCRCIDCNRFLCSKCLSAHENWIAFKKHTVLTMAELAIPENQGKARGRLYCKEHQNKSLKFYCETCQELVCRYCMEFNHEKENHSCLLAEDVAARERELIRVLCGTLEESLNEGQKALTDISNVRKSLKTNAEKAKEGIMHQKENILKTFTRKLEEKAKIMLDEVEQEYKAACEPLAKQESELQAYVEKVKGSVDLSKNLLEKGNDEDILSSKKEIEENVGRVKNECPKKMKPVHNGVIQFKAMRVDYASVIDNLGKIETTQSTSRQDYTMLNKDGCYVKTPTTYLQAILGKRKTDKETTQSTSRQNYTLANKGGSYVKTPTTYLQGKRKTNKVTKYVRILDDTTSADTSKCTICLADITGPICSEVYGVITGNQPEGRMSTSRPPGCLPGYDNCGIIVISYYFPGGTQGPNHPNPGRRYTGTSRCAYLPDNEEGRKVLRLLKKSFDQKLTFRIGVSSTTGIANTVIWNDIHHKTSTTGGPTNYGYPDPTYLKRVQEELAAKGIKE